MSNEQFQKQLDEIEHQHAEGEGYVMPSEEPVKRPEPQKVHDEENTYQMFEFGPTKAYMDQQDRVAKALSTALDTAIDERDEMYRSYNATVLIPKLRAATAENKRLREFTVKLLEQAEEDAIGYSKPGWLAILRDEFDATFKEGE